MNLEPWADLAPKDFARLLVLADALEDECDPRCEGLRWIVENERWPIRNAAGWWWGRTVRWRKNTIAQFMPDWLIDKLRTGRNIKRSRWMQYPTAIDALLSAAEAVVAVRYYKEAAP